MELTGFNNDIPMVGRAEEWWDCYYCGNATAYMPNKCRKCNRTNGFQRRTSKMSKLMNHFKRMSK